MMPRYRDKYGFNKLPNWHLVSARCDLSKVHPLRLDYFPALKIRAPEDCGWDEIAKVCFNNYFIYSLFSVLPEVLASIKWKPVNQSIVVSASIVL
jgi:hypothetical protein